MKVILFNVARDAICHCANSRQWANLHRKETKDPRCRYEQRRPSLKNVHLPLTPAPYAEAVSLSSRKEDLIQPYGRLRPLPWALEPDPHLEALPCWAPCSLPQWRPWAQHHRLASN